MGLKLTCRCQNLLLAIVVLFGLCSQNVSGQKLLNRTIERVSSNLIDLAGHGEVWRWKAGGKLLAAKYVMEETQIWMGSGWPSVGLPRP